ncbi:MAG: hypothetical protein U1E76_08915 [Planctomycetota bacterium]
MLLAWVALFAVLSFAAGVSSGVLYAYQRQAAAQPEGSYADMLRDELGLNDDQYRRIRSIVASYVEELDKIQQRHQDTLRSEIQPLKASINRDIKQQLRPEQLVKFEAGKTGLPGNGP